MMDEMLIKLEYDGYQVYSDGKRFWYWESTCSCGHKDKVYLPLRHTQKGKLTEEEL